MKKKILSLPSTRPLEFSFVAMPLFLYFSLTISLSHIRAHTRAHTHSCLQRARFRPWWSWLFASPGLSKNEIWCDGCLYFKTNVDGTWPQWLSMHTPRHVHTHTPRWRNTGSRLEHKQYFSRDHPDVETHTGLLKSILLSFPFLYFLHFHFRFLSCYYKPTKCQNCNMTSWAAVSRGNFTVAVIYSKYAAYSPVGSAGRDSAQTLSHPTP